MYRALDALQIVATLERLVEKVSRRFPLAGLHQVARELLHVGREAVDQVHRLSRPNVPLRAAVGVVIAVFAVLPILTFTVLDLNAGFEDLADLVQTVEAAVNDLVFMAVALFFLITIEGRIKRRRALEGIRELRSIAHILDMHQLSKDPEMLARTDETARAAGSLTRVELAR